MCDGWEKGIRKAVEEVVGRYALIRRSQWHKREKVVGYLSKGRQAHFREQTLTLHRLGLFEKPGKGLKTTNWTESIMALTGQRTDRVDYWRNSKHKDRWLATALLHIENRLNRTRRYKYLP